MSFLIQNFRNQLLLRFLQTNNFNLNFGTHERRN